MKREDYYVDYGMDVLSINDRIDKIFDDVESRTCCNCRYYDWHKTKDYGHCKEAYMFREIFVDAGFGCNKFERKQND